MKRSETYLTTGGEVRSARASAGLTQKALACQAGLDVNSVRRLERFASIPRWSGHALGRVAEQLPALTVRSPPPRTPPVDMASPSGWGWAVRYLQASAWPEPQPAVGSTW
jgi:hypothetical protein